MTTAAEHQQPNHLLRRARLARPSPSGSGRPLSRQELAEAANAWVYTTTGIVVFRDARYIGRLERGRRNWPREHYRAALRAILGATTDAELGFYPTRRRVSTAAHTRPTEPIPLCAGCPFGRTPRLDARHPEPATPVMAAASPAYPVATSLPALAGDTHRGYPGHLDNRPSLQARRREPRPTVPGSDQHRPAWTPAQPGPASHS